MRKTLSMMGRLADARRTGSDKLGRAKGAGDGAKKSAFYLLREKPVVLTFGTAPADGRA